MSFNDFLAKADSTDQKQLLKEIKGGAAYNCHPNSDTLIKRKDKMT